MALITGNCFLLFAFVIFKRLQAKVTFEILHAISLPAIITGTQSFQLTSLGDPSLERPNIELHDTVRVTSALDYSNGDNYAQQSLSSATVAFSDRFHAEEVSRCAWQHLSHSTKFRIGQSELPLLHRQHDNTSAASMSTTRQSRASVLAGGGSGREEVFWQSRQQGLL